MIAYEYDDAGIFIQEVLIQKNPKNENELLIPKNCTIVKPPEHKDGFVIVYNGSKWEYQIDTTYDDFDLACNKFREICKLIGNAIGNQNFKGGFDEMQEFQSSNVFQTLEGIKLAISWSAANELCVYEAKKIGIGQPEWWYKCWEHKEND